MFFKKKKEKPKKIKKLTSVAFVMAIPANFMIGSIFLLTSANSVADAKYRIPTLVVFLTSVAVTIFFVQALHLSRLRVFLHESKHAILVLITGNKVKGFRVKEAEGDVEFQMYEDRLQYGPFITLAPYCFPLFAIPALLFGVLMDLDPLWSIVAAAALGMAFGVDLETAFHDLHPNQTDFKQIVGGFPASAFYIASMLFVSGSTCLLWAIAGRQGFADAAVLAVGMGVTLAERMPLILRRLAVQ